VSCLPAVGRAHLFIVSSDRKNRAPLLELDFVTPYHVSAAVAEGQGAKTTPANFVTSSDASTGGVQQRNMQRHNTRVHEDSGLTPALNHHRSK
jgi:hypothetical protein